MSIVLTSNVGTEEDLRNAFIANGVTPESEPAEVKPAEEPNKPEQKVEPGADKGAAETAAETEPGKGPEGKSKTGEPQEHKAKGGWQRKVEKQAAEIDRLRGLVDKYEGVETSPKYKTLQAELEEAKGKLAELQPASTETKESGPVKPKRPEMPTLDEFDWDQEKFAEATKKFKADQNKYDEDIEKYFDAITERKTQETLSRRDQEDRQRKAQEESDKVFNKFVTLKDQGAKDFEDWDEVMEAAPKNRPTIFINPVPNGPNTPAYDWLVLKAKAPADLLRFFAKDLAENDGVENDRFEAMDPIDLVVELNDLQRQLVADRKKAAKGTSAPTEEAAPKVTKEPEKAPVTPRKEIAKTPDEPLETVGGHASTQNNGDLNKLMAEAANRKDSKEFNRLLALQHEQNKRPRG